jgi:hypothetical protein
VLFAGLFLFIGSLVVVRYGPFSIHNSQSTIRNQEAQPPALPLPDKPSIVILPFTNLSNEK